MSTQEQARTRMMRQQQNVKNRQQSMLARAAEEVGLGRKDSTPDLV